MHNLNDFVCCVPQIKPKFRANFHQLTRFPTNIDRLTKLYGTIAFMCNWFQNKSPTYIFAVDWDTCHVNWVAPFYFNGVSVRPLSTEPASMWRTLFPNHILMTAKHQFEIFKITDLQIASFVRNTAMKRQSCALIALGEGNPPVNSEIPPQRASKVSRCRDVTTAKSRAHNHSIDFSLYLIICNCENYRADWSDNVVGHYILNYWVMQLRPLRI